MSLVTDAQAQEHLGRLGPKSVFETDAIYTREYLKRVLVKIKNQGGKVCESYEICDHRSCRSSHFAWELADAALKALAEGVEGP